MQNTVDLAAGPMRQVRANHEPGDGAIRVGGRQPIYECGQRGLILGQRATASEKARDPALSGQTLLTSAMGSPAATPPALSETAAMNTRYP